MESDPTAGSHPAAAASFEVAREHKGLSVFDFLDAVCGPIDRKTLVSAAHRGRVRVNGEATAAGTTLSQGDSVELDDDPAQLERRRGERLSVLRRGPGLLIADKPSGLPFDAGGRGGPSALGQLSELKGDGPSPRPAHRLDKQTSGLVIAALGREPLERLTAALVSGAAQIEYVAIVRGKLPAESGVVDVPLGRKNRRATVGLFPDQDHGDPATTTWTVEEQWRGYCRLRLVPEGGGRSHQVRGHLSALGHPALCDRLYGEDDRLLLSRLKIDYRSKRGRPERPILQRPAVHAERLSLPSELAGELLGADAPDQEPVEVVAPLPQDLEVLLSQLRRLFPLA